MYIFLCLDNMYHLRILGSVVKCKEGFCRWSKVYCIFLNLRYQKVIFALVSSHLKKYPALPLRRIKIRLT